jgi:hypothetical protein
MFFWLSVDSGNRWTLRCTVVRFKVVGNVPLLASDYRNDARRDLASSVRNCWLLRRMNDHGRARCSVCRIQLTSLIFVVYLGPFTPLTNGW